MSTHATIKIKGADTAIYVHFDGYDLAKECDYICNALKNDYDDVRVDDDPEYATMRMIAALLKYRDYDGFGFGIRGDDQEVYHYEIYRDGNDVKWSKISIYDDTEVDE